MRFDLEIISGGVGKGSGDLAALRDPENRSHPKDHDPVLGAEIERSEIGAEIEEQNWRDSFEKKV